MCDTIILSLSLSLSLGRVCVSSLLPLSLSLFLIPESQYHLFIQIPLQLLYISKLLLNLIFRNNVDAFMCLLVSAYCMVLQSNCSMNIICRIGLSYATKKNIDHFQCYIILIKCTIYRQHVLWYTYKQRRYYSLLQSSFILTGKDTKISIKFFQYITLNTFLTDQDICRISQTLFKRNTLYISNCFSSYSIIFQLIQEDLS